MCFSVFFFRTDVTSAKDIGLCVGMLSPLQLLVYSSFRRLSNYCNSAQHYIIILSRGSAGQSE